ncbi:MAG: flippase [Thomasclavelia ramosa]|nr:flippase [Thomasclavelia ramosa]
MKKSMSSNIFIYLFKIIIAAAVPLIIFPIASRTLGADGVGKVQYAYTIALYFQLLSALGISSYAIREGSIHADNARVLGKFTSELLLINFVSSTFSTILFVLVALMLPRLSDYKQYLFVCIPYVFFVGISTDWFASIKEDFSYITIRSAAFQIIALVIAVFLLKPTHSLMLYVLILIIPNVLSSITNLIYIKKSVPIFKEKNYEIRKHIPSIIFLFSILVSGNIYSMLDTIMIGGFLDDYSVGLYTAAAKYTRLVITVTSSLCVVFLPRISFYAKTRDKKNFQKLFNDASSVILFIAIPCAFAFFVLSEQVLVLFCGNEFVQASNAMKILAINIVFSAIDGFLGWHVLVPIHKEKLLLFATSLGVVEDIILNSLLIKQYGIEGASIATLISELTVFFICMVSCAKYVKLNKIFQQIVKYVIASLPIAIGVPLLKRIVVGDFNKLFVCGIIFSVIYIVILYILKEKIVFSIMEKIKRITGRN